MSATNPTGVYIGEGDILDYTNSGASTLNNGDVVIGTGACGVVTGNGIAVGATGPLVVHGLYQLPAASAISWATLDKLYWDTTNGCLTNVVASNILIGYAAKPKSAGVTIGYIKFNN